MGENNRSSEGFMRRIPNVVIFGLLALLAAVPVYADRRHGDVENIGNRSVSGRIFGVLPNFISFEKEIALGAQISQEFEQTARIIEDPVVSDYVDKLGQHLVKHSDAKVPFHIKVVDTDEVNAFAFPGGYFYVNKGLILAAENEAELAGVMAHEISHVCARHATERLSKAQYMQFAAIPALFVGGYWTQVAIRNALGLGINLELMGITRESEKDADQLGIQYLWNSGYDPSAIVTFFEKLQAQEKSKPGKLAGFFRTHPFTSDRIAAAMDEQRYLPEKDSYIVNSSEFERVKTRLLAIDNAEKAEASAPNQPKKPTLKRRTNTDGGPDSTDPNGDEQEQKKSRPTLKRPGDSGDGSEKTTN
jgi:beta-barrel assembly-enhancing protease